MARVALFRGAVNPQGPTEARVRAADYGEGPLAAGLGAAGKALGDYAQKQDEVEDIKAKIEANRLAVEHNEAVRERARRAKEVLGEGAEAEADRAIGDISGLTNDYLGRASPRARMLLEPHVQQRVSLARENLHDHGFGEKVKVFDVGAKARINSVTEAAQDEDDNTRAGLMLSQIHGINKEREQFYGHPAGWAEEQTAKQVSGFHKSRALKLAYGENGSARAAIAYAEQARRFMNDDDFNAVLTGYGDNAIDEAAAEDEGYAMTGVGTGPGTSGAPAFTSPAVRVGTDPTTGEMTKRLDPGTFFDGWIVPQEGSRYVVDNNGYGVKYGFNEKSWPGLDVKNLTYDQAKTLFTKEIFNAMNGQNLPPALAAMVVDTRMLAGPKVAQRMLNESGGDIDKYVQLRRTFLNGLAAKDPKKYPGPAWERRTSQLMDYADRLGGDGGGGVRATYTPGEGGGDVDARIAAIKADTSMSLRLRMRKVAALERGQAKIRQDKALRESDAADALVEAELALGDKFTDVKQLPQNVWLQASPQTRAMMTARAKQNVESRPLTPELAQMIAHTKVSNPTLYMSPGFQRKLAEQGVPTSTIRAVAADAGAMRGQIEVGRTDPNALWAIAGPALEGAGINFDTIEAKPPEGATAAQKREFTRQAAIERRQDALRKTRLLDDLSAAEQRWRKSNPGKEPTTADLRQMVGNALTRFGPGSGQGGGRPFFNMTADEINAQIPKGDRDNIISALRSEGVRVTPTAIADLYRRQFISGDWKWRTPPKPAPLPSGPAPSVLTGR